MPTNTGLQIASLQEAITDENTRNRSYNSLWHTYWDQDGVADGPFNARMLNWINTVLDESYTDLPGAMQAFAESRGFYNWDSITDLELAYFASVLFANGEDGAWYDIADTTSMRVGRDGSGGVPGVGDPVGFVMDKRKMGRKTAAQFIASQPELVTNGTFDADSGWLKGTGWTIANGVASRVSASGLGNLTIPSLGTIEGDYYQLTFEITVTTGQVVPYIAGISLGIVNSTGNYTFIAKAGSSANSIVFVGANAAVDLEIDNVSLKHIPGNHLVAPSDAARSVYQTEIVEGTAVDVSSSPELVTNGGFDTGTSGWTASTNATLSVVSGAMRVASSGANVAWAHQTISTTAGNWYVAEFTGAEGPSAAASFRIGNAATASQALSHFFTTSDPQTFLFQSTQDNLFLSVVQATATDGVHVDVDNISIREVPASAARRHKLVFDGVDDTLTSASLTLGDNAAINLWFAGAGDDLQRALSWQTVSYVVLPWNSDGAVANRFIVGNDGAITGITQATDVVNDGNPHVLFGQRVRSDIMTYGVDGTYVSRPASATALGLSSAALYVGSFGSTASFIDGSIYGIVILVDRKSTTEEDNNVHTLLAARSGAVLT
jgi:hypothetical protein